MTGHWNEVGWPDQMEEDNDDARQEKVKELHLLKTDLFMKLIDEKVIPLRSGVLRLVDEAIASGVRLAGWTNIFDFAIKFDSAHNSFLYKQCAVRQMKKLCRTLLQLL